MEPIGMQNRKLPRRIGPGDASDIALLRFRIEPVTTARQKPRNREQLDTPDLPPHRLPGT